MPAAVGPIVIHIIRRRNTVRGRPRHLHDIIALRALAIVYYSTNGRREPAPPTCHGR